MVLFEAFAEKGIQPVSADQTEVSSEFSLQSFSNEAAGSFRCSIDGPILLAV
jgi:hypothetical protein